MFNQLGEDSSVSIMDSVGTHELELTKTEGASFDHKGFHLILNPELKSDTSMCGAFSLDNKSSLSEDGRNHKNSRKRKTASIGRPKNQAWNDFQMEQSVTGQKRWICIYCKKHVSRNATRISKHSRECPAKKQRVSSVEKSF